MEIQTKIEYEGVCVRGRVSLKTNYGASHMWHVI